MSGFLRLCAIGGLAVLIVIAVITILTAFVLIGATVIATVV